MAEAPNPLDPAICKGQVKFRLNAQLRNRWSRRWREAGRGEPSLKLMVWEDLSSAEQEDIRSICRDLASFERTRVRPGHPQRDELDTLLFGLADLFVRWTGKTHAVEAVPYSCDSQFITFAKEALAPVGEHFEVSPKALSSRWWRCIRDVRRAWAAEAKESGNDAG